MAFFIGEKMSDSQMPDLSNVGDPSDLPTPRPAQAFAPPSPEQLTRVARAMETGRSSRSDGTSSKHLSSIRDTEDYNQQVIDQQRQQQVEQHLPRVDDEKMIEEEPFKGGSMMSIQEIEERMKQSRVPQEETRQPSSESTRSTSVRPQMPQSIASMPEARRRSIQDLFKIGILTQTLRIAGFDVTFKTLNSDEYQRAWAMVSMYPEGTVRDVSLRQFILAFSLVEINNERVENLCDKPDITDTIARRLNVLNRLDSELVRRFFDQGYLIVREQASKVFEEVGVEADQIANFTHQTR